MGIIFFFIYLFVEDNEFISMTCAENDNDKVHFCLFNKKKRPSLSSEWDCPFQNSVRG